MKLSSYAKKIGVSYRTAWEHHKKGLIPGSYQLPTGTLIVDNETNGNPKICGVATYARVSSSENKTNLVSQSQRLQNFCAAKGWKINKVVEECGSGLNDNRTKLMTLLTDPTITKIVVEHKDRLTRFGFNYIKTLWDGEIYVINEAKDDETDLMSDFVSLVTSFTARLYGKRRSKRNTEKLIKELNN